MELDAQFEPNGGGGGGGAVDSVNGKTGAVVLDAGDLEYDDEETYGSNTVGAELSTLKSDLSAKYTVPSGGIPSSDMASAVQTSLGKADTALQANQGSGNAGKWLTIANDGTVTAASLPVYSGGVS